MNRLVAVCLAVVAVLAQQSTADGKKILMMDSFMGAAGSHYMFLSRLGKCFLNMPAYHEHTFVSRFVAEKAQ